MINIESGSPAGCCERINSCFVQFNHGTGRRVLLLNFFKRVIDKVWLRRTVLLKCVLMCAFAQQASSICLGGLESSQWLIALTASLLLMPHSLYYNSMLIGLFLLALYIYAFLKKTHGHTDGPG